MRVWVVRQDSFENGDSGQFEEDIEDLDEDDLDEDYDDDENGDELDQEEEEFLN